MKCLFYQLFPDHVISRYFYIFFDPWSGLALGVGSSASTTPHEARSRLTPWGFHVWFLLSAPSQRMANHQEGIHPALPQNN